MTYRSLSLVPLLAALAGCGGSAPERSADAPPEAVTEGGEIEASPDAGGYVLALARRPAAGDRWREQVDYVGRTVMPGRVRERHYAIDARMTVSEAEVDHDVVRVEIDQHLHQDWRSGDRNLGLPPGTVVVAQRRRGGAHVERADGRPLEQPFIEQLADVIDLSLPQEGRNDDVYFQVSRPRAPGERWSIASDYLNESVGGTIDHAEATLERVETVDGVEQAVFAAEVRAHTDHTTTWIRWELVVPTDPRRPILREHRRLEHHDDAVQSDSVYETHRTRTPIDPSGA